MRSILLRRRLAVLLAMALAMLAAAACSSGGSGKSATATPRPLYTLDAATAPGPYAVGVRSFEFVDTSRPTAANGEYPGSTERKLVTEVWYPAQADRSAADAVRDATVDVSGGPYPLIVFAHGFIGSRNQSRTYTKHLASHGYIVAAPDFPLTNAGAPGGPRIGDLVNQPGDVSFVIDSMLAQSADAASPLHGAVDGDAIGLTGHSLGAFTTLLTVYGGRRDPRVKAALPISGSGCFLTESQTAGIDTPIMLLTGSADEIVAPGGNRRAYDLAHAPRYWVQLTGGNHIRFADVDAEDGPAAAALRRITGGGSGPGAAAAASACTAPESYEGETIKLARQQELLRAFATPFFDAYLKRDGRALQFLQRELPEATRGAADYEFDAADTLSP
jgi:predicted dienelactone hydrolase